TYNALRNSPARPGDLVAVQGIGGLGHLAVQFANRMGFRVAAIARGEKMQPLARELGAHHYIDSQSEDPAAALQALGGASVILATAPSGKAMSALIGALRARGRMIVVGAAPDPIQVATEQLLFGCDTKSRVQVQCAGDSVTLPVVPPTVSYSDLRLW